MTKTKWMPLTHIQYFLHIKLRFFFNVIKWCQSQKSFNRHQSNSKSEFNVNLQEVQVILSVLQLLHLRVSPLQLSDLLLQLTDELLRPPLHCLLLLLYLCIHFGLSLLDGMNQRRKETIALLHLHLSTYLNEKEKIKLCVTFAAVWSSWSFRWSVSEILPCFSWTAPPWHWNHWLSCCITTTFGSLNFHMHVPLIQAAPLKTALWDSSGLSCCTM